MLFFHFCLLCVFLANWSAASETCHSLWTHFNGSCYRFTGYHVDWWEAQRSCRTWGGNLAEITSAEENAFLVRLRDNDLTMELLPNFFYQILERNAWIGLRYQIKKMKDVWVSSGKLANYTNWENGQSSHDYEGNCVEMLNGGEWKHAYCSSIRTTFCELPVIGFEYCSNEPCRNGGTCIDVVYYYKCSCPPEFTGFDCEELNNCHPNPCLNGAICEDRDNGYKCICAPGFTGNNCSEHTHCFPNPCLNGGMCFVVSDNYTCYCRSNYSGRNCEETCPANWSLFERSCYNFSTNPADWTTAKISCRSRGGHLAHITSAAENDFLVKLRDEACVLDTNNAWIGLTKTDENTLDTWVLSSGHVANFTNWANNQPSGEGRCAEMWWSGKWNNLKCERVQHYFCESSPIGAN